MSPLLPAYILSLADNDYDLMSSNATAYRLLGAGSLLLLTIEEDITGLLYVVRKEPKVFRCTLTSCLLLGGSGLCERVTALKSLSLKD